MRKNRRERRLARGVPDRSRIYFASSTLTLLSLPVSCLYLFNNSFMFWALLSCISFHCTQRNTPQCSSEASKKHILYWIIPSHFVHKLLNPMSKVMLPC